MLKSTSALITCPKCEGHSIFVIEATLMVTGERVYLHSPLGLDGFEYDNPYEEDGTEDEIAECEDCRHKSDLGDFGF